MRLFKASLRCIVAAGFLAGLAQANAKPPAKAPVTGFSNSDIASAIRFRVDKQKRATGIVVGVLTPTGSEIISYGAVDTPRGRKLDGSSIFEIASLTKVFTSLLLANATVQHQVTLDQPVSALLPKGVKVPSFGGRAITLTDLATHGSGLPLRPCNLHAKADTPNKYAGFTTAQLYGGLSDCRLTRKPGTAFEYSNLGVALLGQGLANRAGLSYDALLQRTITGPLGMRDTRMGTDPKTTDRVAQGHDTDLNPTRPTDDGALDPAGGLKSTANDMLRFLAVFTRPNPLTPAAQLMLTVDRPGDDAATRMALGWRRAKGKAGVYYWSNGSADGSRTFMGFNPKTHVAVVGLANASSALGVDDISQRVLDPGAEIDTAIPNFHRVLALSDADLNRFVGTYQAGPGDRIKIERGETGLIITIGKGPLLMYPETPSRLFAKVIDLEFDFAMAGKGAAVSMTGTQDGQKQPGVYKRVGN